MHLVIRRHFPDPMIRRRRIPYYFPRNWNGYPRGEGLFSIPNRQNLAPQEG